MSGILTTQPGTNVQGAPASALMAMSGRVPMFGADQGYRYTGPFNAGGQYGSMIEIAMPAIMQMLMGSERIPTQFFPEQNVYDQFEGTKAFNASQQAMAIASQRDTEAVDKMLNGLTQLFTGNPLSEVERARNFRISSGVSQYMPLLTQVLGPDLVDQLHGSRGSATVFAQQLHQALRTGVDPITHTVGYSGESAGQITQDVYEQLFAPGRDIGMMKGMSAGQAGMLLNEMQSRGMLGKPLGLLPVDEQRSLLPRELSDDIINRIASQLQPVRDVLSRGETPDAELLDQARQAVRDTHSKLVDSSIAMTQQDLQELPGAQDIIRVGDADRISSRLKNLSGAVAAMRDIFGDLGNPNAPMREIINGLDALTQGGLATMSPGQIEMLVRKTHTIAKQSGIGVDGMLGLMSQNAQLADKLGLDRSFAVTTAQQSALFGAAAGDRLRLDMPAWGSLTKEQMVLGDQQLRLQAAASPLANQMNALMRMADSGMLQAPAGSELAALTAAIKQGQTNYEFDGKRREIAMPNARLVDLLEKEAGINSTTAYSILQDIKGNQEFGQKYNTADTIRRIQTDETVRRMIMPTLSSRMSGILGDSGVQELMQAQGLVESENDFRQMMTRVGQSLGDDFLALDSEVERNDPAARKAMGQSVRNRLQQEIKNRLPQATPEEITSITSGLVEQLGGESGLENTGAAVLAALNEIGGAHPVFKSRHGLHDMLSQDVMQQAAKRDRVAEMAAMTQSAMAGLGSADPVRRIADVFQQAGPGTTLQDVIGVALGGVSADAVRALDPNGGLAEVFNLVQANKQLDPADPAQLEKARSNAAVIKGLVEGGDVAREQLKLLDASRVRITVDDVEQATAAQKEKAVKELTAADQKKQKLLDAKLINQQRQLTQARERLAETNTESDPEKQKASAKVASALARAMAATLGKEEVALGDNRFLSAKGITTKNADGSTKSTAGFESLDVVAATIDVIQRRQDEAKAQSIEQAKQLGNETQEQQLRRAAASGLLRGDLTIGNERLYQQLQDASQRGSDTSILGDLGYQLYADVSTTQIKAINDNAKSMQKLLGDSTVKKDDRDTAVSNYMSAAYARGRQLLGDERSMRIIGSGSFNLVSDTLSQTSELQGLAEQESKRLGKTVTVGDLLSDMKGLDKKVVTQAKKHFDSMQEGWTEIEKRRGYNMLPGVGDAVNRNRQAMTPQELEDLKSHQSFMRENATPAARAATVLDRMLSIVTPEQRELMSVDINQKQLLTELTAGDRGAVLHKSLQSREELLEMALNKGLFKGKKKVSEITDKEESQVIEQLRALPLNETERLDLDRLQKEAAPMIDLSTRASSANNTIQEALKMIRQSPTQAMPVTSTQEKEMKVSVTGTVKQLDDGRMDLRLEGKGLMDQVANALGMLS